MAARIRLLSTVLGFTASSVESNTEMVFPRSAGKGQILKKIECGFSGGEMALLSPGSAFSLCLSKKPVPVNSTVGTNDVIAMFSSVYLGNFGQSESSFSWVAPAGIYGVLLNDRVYVAGMWENAGGSLPPIGIRLYYANTELSFMEEIQLRV